MRSGHFLSGEATLAREGIESMSVRMTAQEIAEQNTILRAVVGSSAHGLAVEGTDDRDEMGVCIEPREYVVGLSKFEQWVYRTQPEGARSGPGDLDLTIYSLRKYVRLAEQGNPSIITMLHSPGFLVCDDWGRDLVENRQLFCSRQAGARYLGYMRSQKERLLGERGQMRVKRPELVEAYGYDTKYAGHILRLGHQGIEYLSTGKITLPMPPILRDNIFAVRRGETSLGQVIDTIEFLEVVLLRLRNMADIPERPDRVRVNEFLVESYGDYWDFQDRL